MKTNRLTLADVLIVVVLFLFLFTSILPLASCRSRESANRIKCASNMRQIALAMLMYAGENNHQFPRTRYIPDQPPVFYTGVNANPFDEKGPQPNDVTAAMFLILRTQDITSDVFVCPTGPADRFQPDSGKNVQDYSNFRSQAELSYAMTNPYPSSKAVEKGFKWDDSLPADFPLMADIGPGDQATLAFTNSDKSERQRMMNSPNHDGDGQNILYADGHCDWCTTAFQGSKNDNIYTYGGLDESGNPISLGFVGAPVSEVDSVLLPAWDPKISRQISRFHLGDFLSDNFILIFVVGIGGLVLIVYWTVKWVLREAPAK